MCSYGKGHFSSIMMNLSEACPLGRNGQKFLECIVAEDCLLYSLCHSIGRLHSFKARIFEICYETNPEACEIYFLKIVFRASFRPCRCSTPLEIIAPQIEWHLQLISIDFCRDERKILALRKLFDVKTWSRHDCTHPSCRT